MKINKAILGICILLLFSAVALASVSSENDISLEYKLDSGAGRGTRHHTQKHECRRTGITSKDGQAFRERNDF